MATDPYSILGITRSASDDEVKRAYREMVRKYHPDRNPGNQAAEDMFKIVTEAYDQIMDERKNGGTGRNTGYGYGNSGYSSGTYTSGYENGYYQAAANYINSGQYRQAVNVLSSIQDRNAQWFFLSAMANSGLGNNIDAVQQAQTAVSLDPNNLQYRSFLNSLQGTTFRYNNRGQNYGYNGNSTDDFCTKLCMVGVFYNACCDGDGCCCC